ncbi:MAG: lipoyl(octanoyl) transferase LipB [Caulobacteraceae bacterium]
MESDLRRGDDATVEWAVSATAVGYAAAVEAMESRAAAIARGDAPELVWLLEHPPLYTAGVSARPAELLAPNRFPVFRSGRGGRYTYHGPGQRVAYVMLDLNARTRDARAFVTSLEAWIIAALARLNVAAAIRTGRVGVWVDRGGGREDKIAAIGIKLRRWVSFHGVSLNVDPVLDHFSGIVPCGIIGHGVTSLADLDAPAPLPVVDAALRGTFETVFGATIAAPPPG